MWYNHLISLPNMTLSPGLLLVLLVTWPYHRTFRYFTLDPATKLAEDLDKSDSYLVHAINHWRISKDHEYDFVYNASTLAAIADISVFSWTDIANTYWLATALFYFSLSLSLWAVILATQQKSVTRTLFVSTSQLSEYDHADGITHPTQPMHRTERPERTDRALQRELRLKVQVILRNPDGRSSRRGNQGRRTFAELNMLYVWQCPLMYMSYGWVTLLLGLTLHVCTPLIADSGTDKKKVAIFYLVTGGSLFINFVWVSAWSFWLPKMTEDVEKDTFRNSVDFSAPSTRSGTLCMPESRAGLEENEKLKLISSKTL